MKTQHTQPDLITTFRVDTMALLKEMIEANQGMGIFKIPISVFQNLLAQVAQRCTEINDPILNKAMFDLTLYELPSPISPEYNDLLHSVYEAAASFNKEQSDKVRASAPAMLEALELMVHFIESEYAGKDGMTPEYHFSELIKIKNIINQAKGL